jgi:hypothetical protein
MLRARHMDVDSTQSRMATFLRENQEKVLARWSDLVIAASAGQVAADEVRSELSDLFGLV